MFSDIVKITIKISKDELEHEEIVDLIKENLHSVISTLEQTGGDVQRLKAVDDLSSMEYVHIKQI